MENRFRQRSRYSIYTVNEQGKMTIDKKLVDSIKAIIVSARKSISQKINHELVLTYWKIGEEIVEIGKWFSRSNLLNMRKFYKEYSDVQTVSGHLTWSSYVNFSLSKIKQREVSIKKKRLTLAGRTES